MNKRDDIEAAKKLVRGRGKRPVPSAEPFLPELRSNIKWKPAPQGPVAFRPEAEVLLVWSFGVPFADIGGLHDWLAANEPHLEQLCRDTKTGVSYLGTYLHLDTGAPRYQTFWGMESEDSETALETLLNDPQQQQRHQQFMDLVKVLRSYWTRDANATDHRYGLARNYIDLHTLPSGGAFWKVTFEARTLQPLP